MLSLIMRHPLFFFVGLPAWIVLIGFVGALVESFVKWDGKDYE